MLLILLAVFVCYLGVGEIADDNFIADFFNPDPDPYGGYPDSYEVPNYPNSPPPELDIEREADALGTWGFNRLMSLFGKTVLILFLTFTWFRRRERKQEAKTG